MLRNRYFIVSAVVLGFWLVMTALLLKREVFVPRLPMDGHRAALSEPRESWMGVYLPGGRRVGFVQTRTAPRDRGDTEGAETTMLADLELSLLGEAARIRMSGTAWTALDGKRSQFEFAVRSGPHNLQLEGTVAGGYLDGRVRTAGEVIPLRVPVDSNPLLSGGFGNLLSVPALEPGDEYVVNTFDPMTLSVTSARLSYAGKESIDVAGESVPATVVNVTTSGMPVKVWVDERGDVVRAETPYGFTLARITPEEAAAGIDSQGQAASADLLSALAIRPRGETPFRGARTMRFHVSGLEPGQALPTDDTQSRVGDDFYAIEVPDEPGLATEQALPEGDWDEFFASDALIQANHLQINVQARTIVGDATDPWQRALAIYQWVYENIEKRSVLSVPSALDVLRTRQGDCNEHTVLFTALARSAGIPTRIALGVVWSEELDGFYYHAWPEVYMGRWIGMDPTLGQPIADATHVKLVTGDIAQWARILPYLGRLQLEITEIQ
jgi:transglutaminase-like putative cysteine protease